MGNGLHVRVPGKLMVAGEFAVLEKNEPLLVMAVDRYVYGSLAHAAEGLLVLHNFDLQVAWDFDGEFVTVGSDDERLAFVKASLEMALRYVTEQGISTGAFQLDIKSELDDGAGRKYGLGSSAAVSVTVVALVLKEFLGEADPYLVFQLASAAHVLVQGNGSGADIAASAYGGVLQYRSFQADWLLAAIAEADSVRALVERDWQYVSINRLAFPADLAVYVGWTGAPASTGNLVRDILRLKEKDPPAFTHFLEQSREAVLTCADGMVGNDSRLFLAGISRNRKALTNLGQAAKVAIDTPLLDKLSDIAESLGGAGKFSGAGGGDCGLAFMLTDKKQAALYEAWSAAGIEPLSITNDQTGISFT